MFYHQLHFDFCLEYDNRTVQVNRQGYELNGTNELLFYDDNVNMLRESISTKEKNINSVRC